MHLKTQPTGKYSPHYSKLILRKHIQLFFFGKRRMRGTDNQEYNKADIQDDMILVQQSDMGCP